MDPDSQLALALQQEEYALLQATIHNLNTGSRSTTVNLVDDDEEEEEDEKEDTVQKDKKKKKFMDSPNPPNPYPNPPSSSSTRPPPSSSTSATTEPKDNPKPNQPYAKIGGSTSRIVTFESIRTFDASKPGRWNLPSPSVLTAVSNTITSKKGSSPSSPSSSSSSSAMVYRSFVSTPNVPLLNYGDPSHEFLDPTPDIYSLFMDFNCRFFHRKLESVELRWSKRMTLCAGICSYSSRNKACIISLSAPLLSLRPRIDLINTLLHEMIHAWEFITRSIRDHDGHGTEFLRIAQAINQVAGTKITKYHNFIDEVNLYRVHVWRCNGICQSKSPYYGYVRRAMNRAPSFRDTWWKDHQSLCGGTFTKVEEPPPKKVSKTKTIDNNNNKVGTKRLRGNEGGSGENNGTTNTKKGGSIFVNQIDNYFVSPFPVTQPKVLLPPSVSSSSSSPSSVVPHPSIIVSSSQQTKRKNMDIISIPDSSSSDEENDNGPHGDTVDDPTVSSLPLLSSSSSSTSPPTANVPMPLFDIFSIEKDENIIIEISDDDDDDNDDDSNHPVTEENYDQLRNSAAIDIDNTNTNDNATYLSIEDDDEDKNIPEDFGIQLNNFKNFIGTLSQEDQENYRQHHTATNISIPRSSSTVNHNSIPRTQSSNDSNSNSSSSSSRNVVPYKNNNVSSSNTHSEEDNDNDEIIIVSPFRK